MTDAGKVMMVVGAVVLVLGALLWAIGRAGFQGLPGDIRYEGSHTRVYFPIVTCIAISALLTLGMWLWRWMSGR